MSNHLGFTRIHWIRIRPHDAQLGQNLSKTVQTRVLHSLLLIRDYVNTENHRYCQTYHI